MSTEKVVLQTVSSAKQRLEELPPSAKLVYKTLEFEGECTQKELAKETRLSARTVRYAISRLEQEELIEQQVSLQDARQKRIRLRSNP
ncbi:helix-turn-helix domain-containing protein [Haloterrigena salinisoli]|uniref:helix-turn-helix domain-containing protein n=1 Tax=Haloterrigena salinisoli TaxID=3132747 RepID=UPI0030CE5E24